MLTQQALLCYHSSFGRLYSLSIFPDILDILDEFLKIKYTILHFYCLFIKLEISLDWFLI